MRTQALAMMFVLVHSGLALAQEETRLLRFPAIHGDSVAFSYAGNLYTASANGGVARRLTSHDGYEMFARFSPDGKWLAFTGQYDGNTEVYLMPAAGGPPKRLTFTATLNRDDVSDRMGPNNIVMGWKNDSEIIFRSRMHDPNDFIGQLYTVHIKGGLPQQIPVPRGGFCSFSPDGKKMAYNRIFREFRTWKRYRGGMANDIWIHEFDSHKTINITENPACDTFPMWHGDKIYFLSDRDDNKRFNLYAFDLPTKTTKQLTTFTDFDIKFPSLGDKAILFENAGYLYRFDLASEKATRLKIQIREDFASGRTVLKDVTKNITSYEIAPDGKRALFGARGDLFTVPAKDGPTRNLTATPGVHERNPKWSPDGKWIAAITDSTGEDEIHLFPQDGVGSAQQLTSSGGPYKYRLVWSPDGKKIMWADKKMRLQFVDVATKQVKLIAQAKVWEIKDYVWSPDGKWVAYARAEEEGMPKVWLYSLADDKHFEVTDGWYDSANPEFSGDGKYLYFVSERDFNPLYSASEWNHAYTDMARIYLVTLAKETPSPFRPPTDEVAPPAKEEAKPMPKLEKRDGFHIDTAGIQKRIVQLPITPGSYRSLTAVGNSLYYLRSTTRGDHSGFFLYDLAAKKETNLGKFAGYEISADRKKMLLNKDSSYYIIDLPKASITTGDALNLSDLAVQLDRHKEWLQIYHESWRQMRDYFYDPGMHGVDWKAVRAKYEPLVAHVNHRADLSYILGEMISELDASHAYVGGGDLPKLQKIQTGLLGAELRQDEKTKYYQIAKILPGNSWDKKLRSPLADIGLNVNEGEYIIAVNGRPTNEMVNIYEALVNTPGKQVRLKINTEAAEKGSREIVVVPIADEQPLYYHAWVQGNIKKVSDATKGQVGYVHIPDMLSTGLNEFAKYYYPQLRKKALIIDVRGNGGGNVSPQIIERLRREIAMMGMSRDTIPHPNPNEILYGPKVCLMNEYSASDGDLFPYRFRYHKLGKLVGKRSWGGVIGIRGTLPFVDGGSLNKPEFASYDVEGKKWIIENHGVDPDIVVENDPWEEFRGNDQQLNRGIEVILEDLRNWRPLPPPPPFPKRVRSQVQASSSFCRANAKEMPLGANEQAAVCHRRGRHQLLAQAVAFQDFQFAAGIDEDRAAIAAEEINLAVGNQRRGAEALADPFLPHFGSCFGVNTGGHAVIVGQEDQAVGNDRTGGIGRGFAGIFPANMGRSGVAGPARLDREKRSLHALDGVDGVADQRRSGDDAVALDRVERLALPEPFSVRRIVAVHDIGAEEDNFVAAVVAEEERRRVGIAALFLGAVLAGGDPFFLAGELVVRDDVVLPAPSRILHARGDEQVADQKRGVGMPPPDRVNAVILDEIGGPDFCTGEIIASEITGAEMDPDMLAVGDGGRAGHVVLFVKPTDANGALATRLPQADLTLPDDLAVTGVDSEQHELAVVNL